MVTPVAPGTATPQLMANSAGLNFINVVGSVCGVPSLRSGPSSALGSPAGAATPAGISLGGLLPSALPGAAQAAPHTGVPFGLKNTSSLRPLNLLQLPGGSLIFNTLQQQQQQLLPPFPPQQPQPPGEQGSEHGSAGHEQAAPAPHAAVLGLAGAGGLAPPQAAVLSQLGSAEDSPEQSLPQQGRQLSSAFPQQPQPQIQQLRLLQHQMAVAAAAQTAQLHRHRHPGSQSKSRTKKGTPTTPKF